MTRTEDWADYLDPFEPDPDLPPEQSAPLGRLLTALAAEPVWSQPPATLRGAVLRAATEEAARIAAAPIAPTAAAPRTSTPPPDPTPPLALAPMPDATPTPDAASAPAATPPPDAAPVPLRRRPRRAWYLSVAGAAAAAVLVAVLAWPRPATTTSFSMAGTALAPTASAVAELQPKQAGLAITLEIKGLSPAPTGAYYAAWLRGAGGTVPVGTFHWHKGGIPINLWSGVGTDRYRELLVTLQREGQPPTPSSEVVLSGHVPAS